jgi:hypothetical protein
MKTKKFEEKLALNKKTIALLSNVELGKVKGGDSDPLICMSGFVTYCKPNGAMC